MILFPEVQLRGTKGRFVGIGNDLAAVETDRGRKTFLPYSCKISDRTAKAKADHTLWLVAGQSTGRGLDIQQHSLPVDLWNVGSSVSHLIV